MIIYKKGNISLSFYTNKKKKKKQPTTTQKYRDGEAKIIRKIGVYQWECELYLLPPHIYALISNPFFFHI